MAVPCGVGVCDCRTTSKRGQHGGLVHVVWDHSLLCKHGVVLQLPGLFFSTQQLEEFTDVNEGEKEVMKLWNLHVMQKG